LWFFAVFGGFLSNTEKMGKLNSFYLLAITALHEEFLKSGMVIAIDPKR